ncbi:hypothetical protein HZ326_3489 [Fusarium oxysporum f. sp. albedinis]|nr:hypothetical protein HZ326_3489 [Fusarium oxysporum f. sp. albedinis]
MLLVASSFEFSLHTMFSRADSPVLTPSAEPSSRVRDFHLHLRHQTPTLERSYVYHDKVYLRYIPLAPCFSLIAALDCVSDDWCFVTISVIILVLPK